MDIYGLQKDGTDKPNLQGSSEDADIEKRHMDTGAGGMGREEGEAGPSGESNMETYTLPCVK